MSLKKVKKSFTITIKTDMTKIKQFTEKDDFENYIKSIRCGNSVHKPKKGKGSYTRKTKHKTLKDINL